MKNFPEKLSKKLDERRTKNALRALGSPSNLVDFSSNDYLGFSKSKVIFEKAHQYLVTNKLTVNGATGSRLLSGNHRLYEYLENFLCTFHHCEAALVFNSGYDANIGLLSCIPQRNDIVLYDELVHASIRDGITLSNAKTFKFKHNDLQDLEILLNRFSLETVYIVTESVFSMDGDSPDLTKLCELSQKHNAYLILDEAHAVGVFGSRGQGLIQELQLERFVFARIVTFGKAIGCHGAAVLGSDILKQYLINFSRPFIYTTGLSPHALATIHCAYNELEDNSTSGTSTSSAIGSVSSNIAFFKSELQRLNLEERFMDSNSAIQCCIISGNETVKKIAFQIQHQGFDVKPILSPTVPIGKERLRFCLHSYNTKEDISRVLQLFSSLFVSY